LFWVSISDALLVTPVNPLKKLGNADAVLKGKRPNCPSYFSSWDQEQGITVRLYFSLSFG
tara:strand:- start:140 stop:319 length:180 start_codon:yes stop_codon:yes gene_type:complete